MADPLTAKRSSEADSLQKALGAVLEGITFYELARIVSADTRVKVTFDELGRRKHAELGRLESLAGGAAKDSAVAAGIYPLEDVSKAECYVCGHVVDTKSMPEQCPSCGTARYTFEKEIALAKVWEIAAETSRKSAVLFEDAAARASGKMKSLLLELAKEETGLAAEAGKELAELRS